MKNYKKGRMTRALQARGDWGQMVLSQGLSGYRKDSECILNVMGDHLRILKQGCE